MRSILTGCALLVLLSSSPTANASGSVTLQVVTRRHALTIAQTLQLKLERVEQEIRRQRVHSCNEGRECIVVSEIFPLAFRMLAEGHQTFMDHIIVREDRAALASHYPLA